MVDIIAGRYPLSVLRKMIWDVHPGSGFFFHPGYRKKAIGKKTMDPGSGSPTTTLWDTVGTLDIL
jgi:hypothetical protein